jgi:LysR family transcriptional regulator, hydrogen peroxide-inducible genes activator
MFSIREVEYVLAVAKEKSISKAARICNVSQPAMTMQISKLENVLGFKIFERAKNNNILTPKGRDLVNHYQKIFAEYQKIKNIGSEAELRVGIVPTIAPYLLPRIVKSLPDLQKKLYFFEQKTEVALKNLQEGELDLVILAFYPKIIPQDLIYKKLYEEEFYFVTHKSVSISINEGIKSDKIILLEEGNCINESIEGICAIHQNNNAFSATSIEVVKAMIAINRGYGILPRLSLESFEDVRQNFKIKPFSPKKYREIGVCYRKGFEDKKVIDYLIIPIIKFNYT